MHAIFDNPLMKSINNLKKLFFQIASKQKIQGLRNSEFMMLVHIQHCQCSQQKMNPSPDADAPGGVRISDLSKFVHSSMPSVSQIVNILEDAGYVTRFKSPKDRRAVLVKVTEEGYLFLKNSPKPVLTLIERAAQTMGEEKVAQLTALLDEFTATLETLNNTTESEKCNDQTQNLS